MTQILGELDIEEANAWRQRVLELRAVSGHEQRIGKMNRVIQLPLDSLKYVNEYCEVLKVAQGVSKLGA
eukprot:887817-Lingulodinium_polyedra.AAC.1